MEANLKTANPNGLGAAHKYKPWPTDFKLKPGEHFRAVIKTSSGTAVPIFETVKDSGDRVVGMCLNNGLDGAYSVGQYASVPRHHIIHIGEMSEALMKNILSDEDQLWAAMREASLGLGFLLWQFIEQDDLSQMALHAQDLAREVVELDEIDALDEQMDDELHGDFCAYVDRFSTVVTELLLGSPRDRVTFRLDIEGSDVAGQFDLDKQVYKLLKNYAKEHKMGDDGISELLYPAKADVTLDDLINGPKRDLTMEERRFNAAQLFVALCLAHGCVIESEHGQRFIEILQKRLHPDKGQPGQKH